MSILKLTAEYKNGRTVISDSKFTAPLKIALPFYREDHTEVMMMAASAGILEGDHYDIEITVKENASLKFTGQSYTKIFKAENQGASQNVKITVENGGTLIYAPCPVIPFGGSIFDSRANVYLCKDSRLAMTDILASGRTAMKEELAFKSFRSRTAVYIDGKPVYLDNRRLVPEEMPLRGIGFFEGYTHAASAYFYGADKQALEAALSGYTYGEAALSAAAAGISVRAAGNGADPIHRLFEKMTHTMSAHF
ncbi:MAG: urease accessory protein UreD [Huintestinicola sp.]|uniref:urease accessory protein UreD n=1 Tax=Huintestinicola sp. TaxID=2981661 RepID=UPI003F019BD6